MSTTKTKSAAATRRELDAKSVRAGGRMHQGSPLRRGDVLYWRDSQNRVTFHGFTSTTNRVQIKGSDGKVRTVARSTFGANLTRP